MHASYLLLLPLTAARALWPVPRPCFPGPLWTPYRCGDEDGNVDDTAILQKRTLPTLEFAGSNFIQRKNENCTHWKVSEPNSHSIVAPVCVSWVESVRNTEWNVDATRIVNGTCEHWNVKIGEESPWRVWPECYEKGERDTEEGDEEEE